MFNLTKIIAGLLLVGVLIWLSLPTNPGEINLAEKNQSLESPAYLNLIPDTVVVTAPGPAVIADTVMVTAQGPKMTVEEIVVTAPRPQNLKREETTVTKGRVSNARSTETLNKNTGQRVSKMENRNESKEIRQDKPSYRKDAPSLSETEQSGESFDSQSSGIPVQPEELNRVQSQEPSLYEKMERPEPGYTIDPLKTLQP
ncbi:MAG: hypothetical protein OEZ20_07680 [candidate division WOR-3 bacterium]|nr:hypothetical protein [candidate division WOR-3 bacterium]